MKRVLSLALFSALFAIFGASSALAGDVLIEKAYGTNANAYPFYNYSFRYAFVIEASELAGNKGKIIEFGFQFSYVGTKTWPGASMKMGMTKKNAAAFSSTYADNYDVDGPTDVVTGGLTVTTTTAPQFYRFKLDTPYKYDGVSNLTVEIVMPNAPTTTNTMYLRYGSNATSCRVYSFNAPTSATGGKSSNFAQNWSMLIKTGSTWTGAASSAWNDPNNWDGEVPGSELGAEIPDSASTPNDPEVPDGITIQNMAILAGAVIKGTGGRIKLLENWENEGGTWIPNGSIIEYAGTGPQMINSAAKSVGSIDITNTTGEVTFTDEFSALNNGTIALQPGATLIFLDAALNFSAATFDNKGQIKLGIDGGGVVASMQSITTSGQNLGNVTIDVKDVLDEVEFLGPVKFDNLLLTGAGNVYFRGTIEVTQSFTNALTGNLEMIGLVSTGDLNFKMDAAVIISGDVTGHDLNHTGAGSITFNGRVDLTGSANFLSIGATATAIFNGAVTIEGNVKVDPNFAGMTDAVTFSTVTSVLGNVDIVRSNITFFALQDANQVNVSSPGHVDLAGGAPCTVKELNGSMMANVVASRGISITTLFSLGGSASYTAATAASTFTLSGDALLNTTGAFEVGGQVLINGKASGNSQIFSTGDTTIKAGSFRLAGNANLRFKGKMSVTSKGTPQVFVGPLAGLTIEPSTEISFDSLGALGVAGVECRGALVTSGANTSTAPRFISTVGVTTFSALAGARINISGLILDNFSPTGLPAGSNVGMRIDAAASVLSLNHLVFTACAASEAALAMATSDVPLVFQGFSCDGTTPVNIDATGASGVRVEVKEADPTSGNKYGAPFEIDPDGVLFWENPPVVDVISNAILPNALADNAWSFQLDAVGGNQPLTWSIANQPPFLSINPMTGELSGMPTRNDIGTHVFVVIAYDGSIPNLTANKVLTLVVDSLTDVGVTIVTPEALVNGKVGESYRYALAAAGGSGSDYTWTLINPNALPQGLFLDSATGEIWGVPSLDSAGVYAVAVRVEDAQGNSSVKSFDVTIHTEFSDPGLIAAAQSDGAGGGCALQNGVSWLLLASIIVLLSALAIRRREQA